MFDKINKVYNTAKSVLEKIKEYFEEIDGLTEKQKEERVDLSMQIYEVWKNIQTLLDIMLEYDAVDQEYIKDYLVDEYSDLVSNYVDLDSYLEDHIEDVCEDFVETDEPKDEDAWALKFTPAVLLSIALDGSQDILNYKDFLEAKEQGMTSKTWVAFNDNHTRKSHAKINGKTIGIDETFVVGDVLMRFPHDYEYAGESNRALKQIIGCRCHVEYHR